MAGDCRITYKEKPIPELDVIDFKLESRFELVPYTFALGQHILVVTILEWGKSLDVNKVIEYFRKQWEGYSIQIIFDYPISKI